VPKIDSTRKNSHLGVRHSAKFGEDEDDAQDSESEEPKLQIERMDDIEIEIGLKKRLTYTREDRELADMTKQKEDRIKHLHKRNKSAMNSETHKVEGKRFTPLAQQERTAHHNNIHNDHESDFGGLSAIDGMGQAPSDVKSQLSYHQLIGDDHGFRREENETPNHLMRKNTVRAIRNPINRKPDISSGVVSIRIDPPKATPVVQERKAM